MIRLLTILRRPGRNAAPLACWWCLACSLVAFECKIGLAGGYLLGITRAMIECL